MIPASSFLLDGDTALVVGGTSEWSILAGPCDRCDGKGWVYGDDEEDPERYECDCDGTGRHTFDIEAGHRDRLMHWPVTTTYRVHVIDVLRVCDPATGCPGPASPHICWSATDRRAGSDVDGCWLLVTNTLHDASPSITLPPDAAPGKWLVRMEVHQ